MLKEYVVFSLYAVVEVVYNDIAALPKSGNRKGGTLLKILVEFLTTVGANIVGYIVGYYVCKWLDRCRKGE